MTKRRPATPLPWTVANGHYQHVTGQDIEYFVHAANAYPKLVEALDKANMTFRDMQGVHEALGRSEQLIASCKIPAESGETLLRELGEVF